MEKEPVIHYALTPAQESCLKDGAIKIWPVPKEDESWFVEMVAYWGGTAVETAAVDTVGFQPGQRGVVTCLDPDLKELATLYAFLTDRRFVGLEQVFAQCPESLVVVACNRELTPANTQQFITAPGMEHTAIGYILANNRQALRRQILLKSALLRINDAAPESPTVLQMTPKPGFNLQWNGNRWLALGDKVDHAFAKEALDGAFNIVNMIAFSDGMDTKINSLVLCGVKGDRGQEDHNGHKPLCLQTGICHRFNMPVEQAVASEKLIGTGDIKTFFFFNNSCNGIVPAEKYFSADYALHNQTSENDRIGAFTTGWNIILSTRILDIQMIKLLYRGHSIGSALSDYNRKSWDMYGQFRILVGDPRLRFASERFPGEISRQISGNGHAAENRENPARLARDVHFLQAFVVNTRTTTDLKTNPVLRKVEKSLRNMHELAITGKNAPNLSRQLKSMQKTMLEYLFSLKRFNFFSDWMKLPNRVRKVDARMDCVYCGNPLTIHHRQLRGYFSRLARTVYLCPSCNITHDMCSDTILELAIEFTPDRRVLLACNDFSLFDDKDWTIFLTSCYKLGRFNTVIASAASGRPVDMKNLFKDVDLPRFPDGPFDLCLTVMINAQLYLFKRSMRGEFFSGTASIGA